MPNQRDIAPKIAVGRWDPKRPPSKDNPIEKVEMTDDQKNILEECRLVVLDALAELGITWVDVKGELKMIVPKELQKLSNTELYKMAQNIVEKNLKKDETK